MAAGLIFFTIRRGINAIITLLLLVLIIFTLIHVILPSPLELARLYSPSPHAGTAQLELIVKTQGLAAPIWVQAWNYITGVFQGRFGNDLNIQPGVPVIHILGTLLPITLELVIVGSVAGVVIGIFTGAIGAANRNRPSDYGVKALYLATWASPPFLVAIILQLILAYRYNLLPSGFYVANFLVPPASVTGFPLIDSLVAGDWTYFTSLVHHMVLPALTIAVIGFGVVTRISRASMLDSMDKDYVKLAYMKGLSKRQVTSGTVLRNALIPIITLLALIFAFSAAGAIIVEDIFNYHGMGFFTYLAAVNLDYPAVLAFTIIIGIFVIVANFAADILYAVADPRVRLE